MRIKTLLTLKYARRDKAASLSGISDAYYWTVGTSPFFQGMLKFFRARDSIMCVP